MNDCTARMMNQPKAAHSSKAATVITAPLIIAVFCLDDYKRLSSLERGLAGLLRLAIASVEQQLGWLRDIGYTDADCYSKHFELCVFGGRKLATARE